MRSLFFVLAPVLFVSVQGCGSGGGGAPVAPLRPTTDYSKGVPKSTERYLCTEDGKSGSGAMVTIVYSNTQVYFTGVRLVPGEVPTGGDGRENVVQYQSLNYNMPNPVGFFLDKGDSAAEKSGRYSRDFSFIKLYVKLNTEMTNVDSITGTRPDGTIQVLSGCTLEEVRAPREKS